MRRWDSRPCAQKGIVMIFLHIARSLENCPFSKMKIRKLPLSPHKSGPAFPGYEWDERHLRVARPLNLHTRSQSCTLTRYKTPRKIVTKSAQDRGNPKDSGRGEQKISTSEDELRVKTNKAGEGRRAQDKNLPPGVTEVLDEVERIERDNIWRTLVHSPSRIENICKFLYEKCSLGSEQDQYKHILTFGEGDKYIRSW